MAKKIARSARGEMVDFDLITIKQQIASAPKPTTVQAREDFVDRKFKRRLKRMATETTEIVPVPDTVSNATPEELEDSKD
jgi:hypothetical protein